MFVMNFTNSDYFTFNVDNSMLLVGQSGSGKSTLEDKLLDRTVKSRSPKELQFVLLDMTITDFDWLIKRHKDHIYGYTNGTDPELGLTLLEQMAHLSEQRLKGAETKPMFFILIEECDMAVLDQKRFDNAIIKINNNTKEANMKLIYSTSRISPQTVSERLKDSFDLIVAGQLNSVESYKFIGATATDVKNHKLYEFMIKSKQPVYHSQPEL